MVSSEPRSSHMEPDRQTKEAWLTWKPDKDAYGSWWVFTHRPRNGEHCPACPECTNNYDRWVLLVAAVVRRLDRTFRERGNVAALRVLDETLRYYGLSIDGYLGLATSPILRLHPDWRILALLLQSLEAPPSPRPRRGRPEALDQQWCDWQTAQVVKAWVQGIQARHAITGWVGLAGEYAQAWGQLLGDLQGFRGIRPALLRDTPPPAGAIQLWMDGHSEALRPRTRRLTAACLTRRIVTYLRYAPADGLTADATEADKFVRKHEVAMKRRLDRSRRRMSVRQPRFWELS